MRESPEWLITAKHGGHSSRRNPGSLRLAMCDSHNRAFTQEGAGECVVITLVNSDTQAGSRAHFPDTLAHQFPVFCEKEVGRQVKRGHYFQASANTLGSGDNSSDFSKNRRNSHEC